MTETFVDTTNPKSRPDSTYAGVINKIAQDGVCPFCPEHLETYHKRPIIEKAFWVITDNMYPYKPSKHHRLIIHKSHITHFTEISLEAWVELKQIADDEMKSRTIDGGTFILRFGDTHFTGASVNHLHAHIIQSDPDDSTYDSQNGLFMRIG